MKSHVLIVEDDVVQQKMLSTLLTRRLSVSVACVDNGQSALSHLRDGFLEPTSLVILDLSLPDVSGLDVLTHIHKRYPDLPVIILTGSTDVQDAVEAMKRGALDFMSKPYQPDRMIVAAQNALKIRALSQEVKALQQSTDSTSKGFSSLIGHDGGLHSHVRWGGRAAVSDIPVLITGETGVGKEVFARAIHHESPRRERPFIAVNCGALPLSLVESLLFGHEKGAFTGATERTIGKFREADGGTIFLDEVGELPLEVQVKLLRVLQQQEIEPVGHGRSVKINVRVVSATNRDLEKAVAEGTFREDLYFRLNVLPIKLPALRERRQDIPLLLRHFVKKAVARDNLSPSIVSRDFEDKLLSYDWPGNVRELENMINRALVMDEDGVLDADDLARLPSLGRKKAQGGSAHTVFGVDLVNEEGALKTLQEIEHEALHMALEREGGNVTRAAAALGVAKSTFYRKMKAIM